MEEARSGSREEESRGGGGCRKKPSLLNRNLLCWGNATLGDSQLFVRTFLAHGGFYPRP